MCIHRYAFLLFCALRVDGYSEVIGNNCVELRIEPQKTNQLERLPIVLEMTLSNRCSHDTVTWYSSDTLDLMEQWAVLVVERDGGPELRVRFVGGPYIRRTVPSPSSLAPGEVKRRDIVRSLINSDKPAKGWAGDPRALRRFLVAGRYRLRLEVDDVGDTKLVSNTVELELVPPTERDRLAHDRLEVTHCAFLEGRDSPPNEDFYLGPDVRNKVDVSRFREVQAILDEFPDSEYARWIRYWKLFHHGPTEQALDFARENPTFPLSDNLMLRMAEGLYGRGEQKAAGDILVEMKRLFPEGDTRDRADLLREKIANRP